MKCAIVASTLATLAVAIPAPVTEQAASGNLEARQSGLNRNELQESNGAPCPQAIFIYARGSTEAGNMGTLGPDVSDGLEDALGADNVWIQGVGGDYSASLADNFLPDGTSQAAIREMVGLFELADSTCPGTQIVAGGYSQGAALAAASIRDVDAGIRDNIVGTVLFGYTKNQQNNGQVPNYPSDRLKVFCNTGDLVCSGQLIIAPPHLAYGGDASGPAPEFLLSKIA